jgi:hypothetical protein
VLVLDDLPGGGPLATRGHLPRAVEVSDLDPATTDLVPSRAREQAGPLVRDIEISGGSAYFERVTRLAEAARQAGVRSDVNAEGTVCTGRIA